MSQFATAQGVVGAVTRTYGRLDFLVNNAGTTRDGPLVTMKEEDFDAIIQQKFEKRVQLQ